MPWEAKASLSSMTSMAFRREAGAGQEFLDGGCGADAHDAGLDAGGGHGDEAGAGCEAVAFGGVGFRWR